MVKGHCEHVVCGQQTVFSCFPAPFYSVLCLPTHCCPLRPPHPECLFFFKQRCSPAPPADMPHSHCLSSLPYQPRPMSHRALHSIALAYLFAGTLGLHVHPPHTMNEAGACASASVHGLHYTITSARDKPGLCRFTALCLSAVAAAATHGCLISAHRHPSQAGRPQDSPHPILAMANCSTFTAAARWLHEPKSGCSLSFAN